MEPNTESLRLNLPYLLGVYIAVNAIRDAYLLVDGPQCVSFKAEHVAGKHDWRSTLLDPEGFHRIVMTGTTWDSVAFSREEKVGQLLERVARRPEAGLVLVSTLTMCGMTGVQYDRLIRPLRKATGKPLLEILCDSLDEDWLDGYAAVWEALARTVALPKSPRRKNAVVLVGHLMDRNEGDQIANLGELERMLAGVSLELACAWPSGGRYADLGRAAGAAAVVSLPYAREAGKILAARLKVPLIETDLPFGLEASAAWVKTVAGALGRDAAARRFVDAELRATIPALEWAAPKVFLGRRLLYMGDPYLLEGFCELSATLGARVENAATTSRKGRLGPLARALVPPPLEEPQERPWLKAALTGAPYDLCVTNNVGWQALGLDAGPVLEFGFPSHFHHALALKPFLGFRGFLHFADRLTERLMHERMCAVTRRLTAPP